MGCDIHFHVEKEVEGVWQPVKGPDPWAGSFGRVETTLEGWAYSGRNYELFALLADVRNYSERITPLAQPRGLPANCSSMIKEKSDHMGYDGHSHSYFTLPELQSVEPALLEEICATFIDSTIPKLEKLAQGKPETVRIIFWFDN